MTYQDLKTLETAKVIKVITTENWKKADNGRCYRIVAAHFSKASLYFIEYEYLDMLHFSTYITSANNILSACADLAQKAFKKLANKLEVIKCNKQVEETVCKNAISKLNSTVKAKESAAQAERSVTISKTVMKTSKITIEKKERFMSLKNVTIIDNKIILNGRNHKQADYICKLICDKLSPRAYRIDYNAIVIPSGFHVVQEGSSSILSCTVYNEIKNGKIIAVRS